GGEVRILGAVSFEELRPFAVGFRATRSDSVFEVLVDAIGNQEFRVFRPSVRAFRETDFFIAEWFAVSFRSVLLMRRAVPDMAVQDDERGTAGAIAGLVQSMLDALDVIRIADSQDVPAVSQEPHRDILRESDVGVALDRYVVVVVNPAEVIESQM